MKDRTIVWVLVAFVLGFILPVCGCAGMGLLAVNSLRLMASQPSLPRVTTGDAVAVLQLTGIIGSSGQALSTGGVTPALVADLLTQADELGRVKAIVVRVNSPGGSVVASDEIYHMLLDFDKPVVVWLGDRAASGGYYIACGGDYVISHPDTLTGSIGVISQFIDARDLLDEVGVDVTVLTTGPYKDMGSLFRELTEQEQEIWREILEQVHTDFVETVVEARDLPEETVRELADGRIYSGQQALERGLVDAVGLPSDAVSKAAELAGIEGDPQVIELRPRSTLLGALYGLQGRYALPPVMRQLDEILNWAGMPSVEYRVVHPLQGVQDGGLAR